MCLDEFFLKKKDGFVLPYQKKVVILQYQNALWCNGSTPDSGSVCEGSSPSKATKSKSSLWWFALFLFVPARNRGTADILMGQRKISGGGILKI